MLRDARDVKFDRHILFAGKLAAGAGLGTGARLRGGEMERRRLVPRRGSWNVSRGRRFLRRCDCGLRRLARTGVRCSATTPATSSVS